MDTCGAEGGVALTNLHAPLQVPVRRTLPGRETQERLMTAIEECLHEAKIQVRDVTLLAATSGPGSFTGVRIGLAAIKGLAEGLGIPVVAVSRLRLLAGAEGEVTALLDAGRGDVYAGAYRDGEKLWERMMPRADAAEQAIGRIVVAEEILREAGEWRVMPGVVELLQVATVEAAKDNFADPLTLDANYLRIPDAEIALKARG